MTKARNISDLLDANGDVKSGALDNVPPSNDASALTTGTLPDARLSSAIVNQSAFKNIIINGDMSIAQRGTSATGITGTGYNTLDRFQTVMLSLGTWTQSQSTDVPSGEGFANSLKMDCTTADASPSSGDFLYVRQIIEGQNLQYLKKGTANAESLTLSFWVKSNKTGKYIIELYDADNTRTVSLFYNINISNTWEKKIITFAGDTVGSSFDNDNNGSLRLQFWLGAGSDYTSGTLATSWSNLTGTTNRAVGQVNLADDTANEWYITGVQLEAGTTASDFEFLPYDVNLQRCQRYYHEQGRTITVNNYEGFCIVTAYGNNASRGVFYLPTTMRSIPSFSSDGNFELLGASAGSVTAISLADGGGNPAVSLNITASGMTAGNGFQLRSNNDADAVFKFNAEL